MAAQKYSVFFVFLIVSCVASAETKNIVINNDIEGCFTLKSLKLDLAGDPVVLHASVFSGKDNIECPCKSALVKYSVNQKKGSDFYTLLEGSFTTLEKDRVLLPIAAQKQLILPTLPINVLLSCSSQ